MVKHCVSNFTQRIIDQTTPPKPTDPEVRIKQFQDAIDSGFLEFDQELRMKAEIARLQSVIDDMAGNPTKYRPDPRLRGGL